MISGRAGSAPGVVGINLDLRPGRILGVVGPNGSGRSTLVDLLSGFVRPTTGQIWVDRRDVTGARPWRMVRVGVARTFETTSVVRTMTVVESVAMASAFGRAVGVRRPRGAPARRDAVRVLERVGLDARQATPVSGLGLAELRRLELARALASRPRALLLDGILTGLTPLEVDPVLDLLDTLRAGGLAVLLADHAAHAIAGICDELLLLAHGRVANRGPVGEVLG